MESMPFIEAIRQLRDRVGYKNCALMHVSLVPLMASTGEQKTKPTQHSVKELRALGLHPDFVVCRSETPVNRDARDKLSCHCQVAEGSVISVHDVSNIYRVPQLLLEQNIAGKLGRRLRLGPYAHMHEMRCVKGCCCACCGAARLLRSTAPRSVYYAPLLRRYSHD